MKFLHSIQSIKALSLAAAIAATLITTNVVPSVAQTPTGSPASPAPLPEIPLLTEPALIPKPGKNVQRPGAIEFIHKGAYVAEYFVSYNLNGNSVNLNTNSLSQKKRFEIPGAATNVQVSIFHQLGPNRRAPIAGPTTSYRPSQIICFTTFGTVFNPQFSSANCK